MERVNGTVPMLLAELRLERRHERAQMLTAVALAVAVWVARLVVPPAVVLPVQVGLLAAMVAVIAARRPCATCGRWGRHALACGRGRR